MKTREVIFFTAMMVIASVLATAHMASEHPWCKRTYTPELDAVRQALGVK